MTTLTPPDAGLLTLDDVLRRRRTNRDFSSEPLPEADLRHLLWAAQGVTGADGRRTAPSAGATYAFQVYGVTPQGIVRYVPATDDIVVVATGDRREALSGAGGGRTPLAEAAAIVVLAGDAARLEPRFGVAETGRYLAMEAGHIAENVLLEATALGLACVPVGLFDAAAVQHALGLPSGEVPIELVAVGHPRG